MNLKIELKDPKYCDWCPCLEDITIDGHGTGGRMLCRVYLFKSGDWEDIDRPAQCIRENGE